MIRPRVAVVGGGLAGMAAAAALCDAPCDVHLFEARRKLGGRATSFRDPATGGLVDFCQHVSMGCCTNLADFCRRAGITEHFSRERTLHFVGTDGRIAPLAASRWLPAPLHLGPAFLRLPFLSLGDRLRIVRGLWALARTTGNGRHEPTIAAWLSEHGQTSRGMEQFWSVVLVSALGETLVRSSLSAARKVFVDGFMSNRSGYEVLIPKLPLSDLFGERVSRWLQTRGVKLRTACRAENVERASPGGFQIRSEGAAETFDFAILATTWRQLRPLLAPVLVAALPWLDAVERFESSPITGVHMWFDREITALPHAVLVGRLGQWLFNRGKQTDGAGRELHAYQVVMSAVRDLAGRNRDRLIQHIREELEAVWPITRQAALVASKVVTEQHAVFCASPGLDCVRPKQATLAPGLFVAGDWTATGWPATMEGAVRSGYLAAEGVLESLGQPGRVLVNDLPISRLARCFLRPAGPQPHCL